MKHRVTLTNEDIKYLISLIKNDTQNTLFKDREKLILLLRLQKYKF